MPPDFSAGGGYTTERWRSRVVPLAKGIPVDFALAWIDKETGGRPTIISSLGERGLFQIHPDERAWLLGLTPEQFEALSDPAQQDTALQVGMRMIRKYAAFAKRYLGAVGVEWHGLDFWRMVKLHHGAFALPKYTLEAFARAHGRGPADWQEFRTWLLDAAATNVDLAPKDPVLARRLRELTPRVIANAEETGRRSGLPLESAPMFTTLSDLLRTFKLMI